MFFSCISLQNNTKRGKQKVISRSPFVKRSHLLTERCGIGLPVVFPSSLAAVSRSSAAATPPCGRGEALLAGLEGQLERIHCVRLHQ